MSETRLETNVVRMRFDNERFEKNIKQSTDSLDRFKKKLDIGAASGTFNALEKNIKKVDLSPLSKGIEKVQASFTFLDTLSATVYHRLSNRLIDIGKKITESVSTQGIKSGFSEYELKMNSFKTIQASAGKDFTDSQINSYLEELNRYADKTIYSFSDMTNNIGKFTNAGVKLNVAVKAIQGISNEAAISGANAQEASRAMYNFSQALSSGYVKLIDWKSIELANMATEEFKTQLLETAKEQNVLTKAQNGMYKTTKGKLLNATHNFNESLADQWLTTDVLTKTLSKYADETTEIGKKAFEAAQKVNTFSKLMDTLKESVQSGWSMVIENIFGNLKEATALWTGMADAISNRLGKMFSNYQKLTGNWKELGGRARAIEAIKKILSNVNDVFNSIASAWRSVFSKSATNSLMNLTVRLERLANRTKLTNDQLVPLKNTFKGIFSVISILKEEFIAFKRVFGGFFIRILKEAIENIFGVSGSLGQQLVVLRKNIIESKAFYKIFNSIVSVLEKAYNQIKKVIKIVWDMIVAFKMAANNNGGLGSFINWLTTMKESFLTLDFKSVGLGIIRAIKTISKIISETLENTFDFYKPIKNKLIETKNKIINSKIIDAVINIFKSMVGGIQKIFDSFKNIRTDGVDEFTNNTKKKFGIFEVLVSIIKSIYNAIVKILKGLWTILKPIIKVVGNIISTIAKEILGIIRRSDLGDVGIFLASGGIGAIFETIKSFFDGLKKISPVHNGLGIADTFKKITDVLSEASRLLKAKTLKEIATSILMLAGAIFIMAMLPEERVMSSTVAIIALFKGLTSVIDNFSAVSGKMRITSSVGITALILSIASAVLVLSASLAMLSLINYENTTKALMTLGSILSMIVISVSALSKLASKGKTSAATLLSISVLIGVLTAAITTLTIPIIAFSIIIAKQKNGANNLLKAVGILTSILMAISLVVVVITKMVKNLSIKDVIKVAGTLYLYGMVFKKIATSLALVMATIGALAIIITKGYADSESLETAGEVMIGILAAISLMIISFAKIAEKISTNGVTKMSATIVVVSMMISILSGIFIAISALPGHWIERGIAGFSAIITALITVFSAFAMVAKIDAFKNMSFLDIFKTVLFMGMVIVPFTVSVSILLLAIGKLLKRMSDSSIDSDTMKASVILIASIGSFLIILVASITKIAKSIKMRDAIKLSLISGVIMLLISSLTLIVLAISKLAHEDLIPSSLSLMAIATSLVLVFAAIKIITETSKKSSIGLVNGLKNIVMISLVLYSLTGILSLLTTIANKDGFDKAVTTLLKLGAAITAIAYITGRSMSVAKGIKVLSTAITGLSIAAASFGVFTLAVIKALTLLKKLNDEEINAIERNIKKLGDVFYNNFGSLAKIIGTSIAFLIKAIIDSVVITIVASADSIFDSLVNVLDILIKKAPALINKALQLLVVVLGAIEMGLAPVVFTAIKVAIKFVEALAQGIRDNSDKILDAISSLIDAVAELISKAIARILGLKEWEGAYKALKPIIKNFGSLLIGMFVIEKLRSNASAATSILSAFVAKVSALKTTLAAGQKKQAIWDFLGLTNMNAQLQGATGLAAFKFKDGLSFLTKAGVLGKAAGIGALIGTAIGTPIAKVIDYLGDNAVDGIKDIYSVVNQESAQLTKDIYSMGDAIRNRRKELKSDLKEVNTTYDTQYSKMKRLANDIDQTTGKIKKGKEKEVAELVKQANSELGTNLTIENGIVSAIDEQGKKKKFELDQIKEIIEQEKLRNMLEKQRAKRAETEEDRSKAKEQYDKAKTELEDFEKLTGESGELFQAYKRMRELEDKSLKDLGFKSEEERGDAMQELYKKYADLFSQYDLGGPPKAEKFEELRKAMLGENNATYVHLQSNVNEAKKNLDALNEELDDLDYAENALISGSADQIHKATLLLNGKYKRNQTDAQRKQSLDELDAEIDKMFKSINDYGYSQIKDAIEAAKEYAKESGKDTTKYDKLQNDLDNMKGFTAADDKSKSKSDTTTVTTKIASVLDPSNLGSGWKSEMKDIGSNMAKGQFNGYQEESAKLSKTSGIDAKNVTVDALKSIWDINSPSKVMANEVGTYLGQGLIVGMEDIIKSYDPTTLASGFINKLQSYIFPGLALVTSGKGTSLSSLTPVNFGMSQNGSGNYMGSIPNMPIGMNLPYKSDLQLINQSLQNLTDRMVEQTDSIIAEVGSLRDDVNLVGDRLSHLQVVIDSRTIVGELAPAMNDELLKYGERINRGV